MTILPDTDDVGNPSVDPRAAFHPLLCSLQDLMDLSERDTVVCALYVLLTWTYDRFPMVPILRAIGQFSCGKTRLIEGVLTPLVYRPFKTEGGSPTLANLRRTLISKHREGQSTLVIDDVGFDAGPRTEMADIMINRCREGGSASYLAPDGRNGYGQVSQVIFGPTLLGSRLPFTDVAVESRVLDIDMAAQERTKRILPDPPWKGNEKVLTHLLQTFRAEMLELAKPHKLPRLSGIDDRVWDLCWPLVWLAEKCQYPGAKEAVEDFLRVRSEAMAHDKAEEPVVMVLAALVGIAARAEGLNENPSILLSEIRRHIYETHRVDLSSHRIGRLCRSALGLEVFTSSGQQKVRGIDWNKLWQLGTRFGYKDELLESKAPGPNE